MPNPPREVFTTSTQMEISQEKIFLWLCDSNSLLTNSSLLCRAMGITFLTGICKSLMSHFALLLASNMELTKVTTVVTDYIT